MLTLSRLARLSGFTDKIKVGCSYVKTPLSRLTLSSPRMQTDKSYSTGSARGDVIFRQLFDHKTFTYTYILADSATKDALLIDPVLELVLRDLRIIHELGLNLKYAVNTHVHADHITGSGKIKTLLSSCRSMISEHSGAQADIMLKEGQNIDFGKFSLECRCTPGHTNGCMTFVWHDQQLAFTGDALLIRGCGRTDFQQGSSDSLYKSVHEKILSLPDHYLLYPGHDYTGQTRTTVAEEKAFNARLNKPLEDFRRIMNTLNLPYPKQIDRALPANLLCGVFDVEEEQ